jgi:hypothetical protein
MDFVQQAADRGIEPLNDRQQGFDVGALIGDLCQPAHAVPHARPGWLCNLVVTPLGSRARWRWDGLRLSSRRSCASDPFP